MKEQGIIILEDGTNIPFGTYYCPDEPQYLNSPSHESSFIEEVVPSISFRLSNHIYEAELDFYQNSLRLSLEGVVMIINNQKSTNYPTEVLAYVPNNPSLEQLASMEESEVLSKIEIQKIYQFESYNFDDYIEYDSFSHYIKEKKECKKKS